MPLNEATKKNLQRKSAYVDVVQLKDGVPLPSWIDISLTELCNRSAGHANACPFCPRIDPKWVPNQNLHMSMQTASKIATELDEWGFLGSVVFCGFGEPLLHPKLADVVSLFTCRVEVVTNGDFLGPEKIAKLRNSGVDYFVVSMYDGPQQIAKLQKAFTDAECPPEYYLLRDRWHSEADAFGLKLTNRAGTVTVGDQEPVDTSHPCWYTTYMMQLDWNGDVLLCPQDWHRRVKFGNVNTESLLDIWTSKRLHKRRTSLSRDRTGLEPCKDCNCDGCLHGHNHLEAWGLNKPVRREDAVEEAQL
jgi:radical SAM protein with 4Fe4S-binding SPASM domain